MEYIQAVLFALKYVLGPTGNTDLQYLFSAIVLLFYMWRRREKAVLILKAAAPIFIVCIGMAFFYPAIDALRVLVFFGKMLLDISFLLFVAYNSRKWRMTRFVSAVALFFAAETAVAFLLPGSRLWAAENLAGGAGSVPRLKLFYSDAGALSFACGFILILLVYQLLTEEVVWHQVVCAAVVLTDIYLSYGMGGITTALVAVVFMLCLAYSCNYKDLKSKHKKNFICLAVLAFAGLLAMLATNPVYVIRIWNMIAGTDHNFNEKLRVSVRNLGSVLKQTGFFGVGFGNANTAHALQIMEAGQAYPNSFLRLVAEGGVFGIALVLSVAIGLAWNSFKYGSIVDKSLCIYILVYQLTGGYFTDPANYLVYGLILGSCITNKLKESGTLRCRLFMPVIKEKLWIGQIGHKRLFGREGGVEVVVEEISGRLVEKGHRVDAYDRSGDHVSGPEFNHKEIKDTHGIHIITIPTIQRKGFAALVYSFLASIYAATKDYDVIHYHAEGPCAFLWIPSILNIRTVATIHGLDWQRTGKWGSLASRFIRFGERVAANNADEIIVLSRQVQAYFRTTYNRKTNFIPNGVNRPVPLKAELITQKWGLQPGGYILCLARLTAEKGFHYAIEAFRGIDTEKKLVIGGGSSDSDAYVETLKELAGDDERILFTGFVNGAVLEELYSNAYIYCLPSDLEGMPMSLLEAMSYGNCCLVSDIPECTSVTGKHGRSFAQGDVEDLRREMEDLLSHPETVEEYKSRSADYVCSKYRWDDVVEQTLRLYRGEEQGVVCEWRKDEGCS